MRTKPRPSREERRELRDLATWRGAPDRPRGLLGLIGLGHVAVAPFLVLAATYSTCTGHVSLFLERRLVGRLVLGKDGLLHAKRDLTLWLPTTHAPDDALLALRRHLEHQLVRALRSTVWPAVDPELEQRREASLAPPRATRPKSPAEPAEASR